MKKTVYTSDSNTLAGNMDTPFLKILALIFMLIDHLGKNVFPGVPEMRIIGRMALPLYAWCMVVGSVKTRSPLRYAFRLLIVAVVSQPIYMMALNHSWSELNIMFTLLIALVCIQGIRINWMGSSVWIPLLCFFGLGILNKLGISVDYGWKGILFVILLYLAKDTRAGLCSTFLAYSLFWGASSTPVRNFFDIPFSFLSIPGIGTLLASFFRLQGMIWLSLPLIAVRTNTGLKLPKRLGYGIYPLHLIVLIIIELLLGTPLSLLLKGF